MALELPTPNPSALDVLTPTRANDLIACPTRVAWQLDARFKYLRRPNPASALGALAHAVMEDVGHGLLADVEVPNARTVIDQSWDDHEGLAVDLLSRAWSPARPPPPEDWPGYELTRARVTRRALKLAGRRSDVSNDTATVAVEHELVDSTTRMLGRPDRVEHSSRGICVVDLKTGVAQQGPSPAQRRQLLLYAHLVHATSGELPATIAIEDASGRRWEETVDIEEIHQLLDQLLAARTAFDQARAAGKLLELAEPGEETCRWCAHRVICRPYWDALDATWRHGSVLGAIDAITGTATQSASIVVDRPVDASGQQWTIAGTPPTMHVGNSVAVVDAGLTSCDDHLRWRWSTLAWPPPDGGVVEPLGDQLTRSASLDTTDAATSSGESCSQTRITVQPASLNAASTARSRATFRVSFGPQ
jgi:RecB family exonuclease